MDQQTQLYRNILPLNTAANVTSAPVMAADFKTMVLSVITNAAANFVVSVIRSDMELPPDPSLPASATNMYTPVGFTDQTDQVFYNGASYNPSSAAVSKSFNVETNNARWLFVQVSSRVAGTLLKCDVTLFAKTS